MQFSNPANRFLGSYTWANLQAAFANGGGALAALPAEATVYVSDLNAEFRPNSTKAYWVPVGVCVFGQLSASVAHTGTVAETNVYTYAIPAGLMTPISCLRWRPGFIAAANTGNASVKYRYDSTQIDSNAIAASAKSSSLAELRNYGSASANAYMYNISFTANMTLATASAWTFKIGVVLNNSSDTVTLYAMALELS